MAYRLRRLEANNTPTVLVITYWNRAYEDALIELNDIVSEAGFNPIAACAFIGEHSWSLPETPIAQRRPNGEDLVKAGDFGKQIKEKYEGVGDIEDLTRVKVPGTHPYTLRTKRLFFGVAERTLLFNDKHMSPRTEDEICTLCGTCAEVCPTGAVTLKNIVSNPSPKVGLSAPIVCTDGDACVRSCPSGARVRRPLMVHFSGILNKNYAERKEPETYL